MLTAAPLVSANCKVTSWGSRIHQTLVLHDSRHIAYIWQSIEEGMYHRHRAQLKWFPRTLYNPRGPPAPTLTNALHDAPFFRNIMQMTCNSWQSRKARRRCSRMGGRKLMVCSAAAWAFLLAALLLCLTGVEAQTVSPTPSGEDNLRHQLYCTSHSHDRRMSVYYS